MFFFIGTEEAFSLREDVPFKLKLAAKVRGLKIIEHMFMWPAALCLAMAGFSLGRSIGAAFIGEDWLLYAQAMLIVATVSLILAIILGVLGYVAIWLKRVRQDILDGKYRQYYVVSSDASFTMLFTSSVRGYLKKSGRWNDIRALAANPRVMQADAALRLLSDEDAADTVERSIEFLNMISVLQVPIEKLGIDEEEHFASYHCLINQWLKVRKSELETLADECTELIEHHFG